MSSRPRGIKNDVLSCGNDNEKGDAPCETDQASES